jgi:hypothetical protein
MTTIKILCSFVLAVVILGTANADAALSPTALLQSPVARVGVPLPHPARRPPQAVATALGLALLQHTALQPPVVGKEKSLRW